MSILLIVNIIYDIEDIENLDNIENVDDVEHIDDNDQVDNLDGIDDINTIDDTDTGRRLGGVSLLVSQIYGVQARIKPEFFIYRPEKQIFRGQIF